MKTRYLEGVLTVIAGVLCAILVELVSTRGASSSFGLVAPAYASAQGMSADVLIFPVGNQDVRKWVVFDRRTSILYKYDDDGSLQDSWDVRAPGEKFQKRH